MWLEIQPNMSGRPSLLDEVTVHYNPLTGQNKITAVEYKGVFVRALDLCGTMMKIDVHCSKAVFSRYKAFLGADVGLPDLVKAAKFQCILFVEKYHPGAEWEMDDETKEWDKEVSALLDRCAGFGAAASAK